jgi:hypothetical protein
MEYSISECRKCGAKSEDGFELFSVPMENADAPRPMFCRAHFIERGYTIPDDPAVDFVAEDELDPVEQGFEPGGVVEHDPHETATGPEFVNEDVTPADELEPNHDRIEARERMQERERSMESDEDEPA